jgi:putative transcriptional regulator
MSTSKLAVFAMLAIVFLFSATSVFDSRIKKPDLVRTDSWPQVSKIDSDEPRSYPDDPAKSSIRSQISYSLSEILENNFLPIQSKNPDELGMGKLLVASRGLGDPNFAKTVVLLVQCDPEGVVGLTINRRTNIPLSRVFKEFGAAKELSDPVYAGGPVDIPTVFALMRSQSKIDGAQQITGGIQLISTKSRFEQILTKRPIPADFHVYLGYAGWTRDQLRQEIQLGAWFIFQGDTQTVFNANPDSLWPQLIRQTELKLAKRVLPDLEGVLAMPTGFPRLPN